MGIKRRYTFIFLEGVVMNQFKAGDTNAVVLAGMCTALAVVLSMVGFYVQIGRAHV